MGRGVGGCLFLYTLPIFIRLAAKYVFGGINREYGEYDILFNSLRSLLGILEERVIGKYRREKYTY